MQPGYVLNSNALKDIPKDKYTISVEGEADNTVVTYTFSDISMNKPVTIDADNGANRVNYVSYDLNGGTWDSTNHVRLTPGNTINKPTDPTKEGYIFKGWSGTSTLTSPTSIKEVTNYSKDNPYRFDEVYPVAPEYQEGSRRVSLKAIWEEDDSVEILGKHEFRYIKTDTVDEIYFKATNPDNPNESIEIPVENPGLGAVPITQVPAGWKLEGQIKMKPTYLIHGTGDGDLPISDFIRTAEGDGDQRRWVYTLPDNYTMPNSSVDLRAWQFEQFNQAHFDLNGGKWDQTPEGFKKYQGSKDHYYTLILPLETVRKPQDPTRSGYEFVGWSGTSKLTVDPSTGTNNVAKVFTPENPYKFDEIDDLKEVGVERLQIVRLKAEWVAKKPEFETKIVTIKEGDDFDPNSLIDGDVNYNDDGVNESNRNVDITGDYDPNTAGEYDVTITVTNGVGGTTTKTAKLIVKKKLTPIIPAPKLTANDKTIHVGDEFDPLDMVEDQKKTKKMLQ